MNDYKSSINYSDKPMSVDRFFKRGGASSLIEHVFYPDLGDISLCPDGRELPITISELEILD